MTIETNKFDFKLFKNNFKTFWKHQTPFQAHATSTFQAGKKQSMNVGPSDTFIVSLIKERGQHQPAIVLGYSP